MHLRIYAVQLYPGAKIFKKSITLNKNIKKESGLDVIYIYKRASNILSSEKDNSNEIIESVEEILKEVFKNQINQK